MEFDSKVMTWLYDPAKKEFADELINYSDTFNKIVFTSFKGDTVKEAGKTYK